MSEQVIIAAEPRSIVGKKVKQLRREGLRPAVIYGGVEPHNVQFEARVLRRALRVAGRSNIIKVEMNDKTYRVVAREIQQHLTRGDILHVDFLAVADDRPVRIDAQVVSVGVSPLMAQGLGRPNIVMRTVPISAHPDDLVSEIEVDLSRIKTPGDRIRVGDLRLPEGVTAVAAEDATVVSFMYKKAELAVGGELEDEEEEEEEEGGEDEAAE